MQIKLVSSKAPIFSRRENISLLSCGRAVVTKIRNLDNMESKCGRKPLDLSNSDCWSLILTSAEIEKI